jgi:hypothetical protein
MHQDLISYVGLRNPAVPRTWFNWSAVNLGAREGSGWEGAADTETNLRPLVSPSSNNTRNLGQVFKNVDSPLFRNTDTVAVGHSKPSSPCRNIFGLNAFGLQVGKICRYFFVECFITPSRQPRANFQFLRPFAVNAEGPGKANFSALIPEQRWPMCAHNL